MKHIITIFFIFLSLPAIAEKYCVFTPIKGTEGLGGNRVRNITQLPDGRMMIITEGLLNLYDGTDFNYLHYNQNIFAHCLHIQVSITIHRFPRIYVDQEPISTYGCRYKA